MELLVFARTMYQLVTTVTALIQTAEALFPGKNMGAQKMEHVQDQLAQTISKVSELQPYATALAEQFKPVISATVELFNRTGAFKGEPAGELKREPEATQPAYIKPDVRVGVGPEEGAPGA